MLDVGALYSGEERVDTVSFDRLVDTDEALRYVTYHMFGRPYSFIFIDSLNLGGQEWSSLCQHISERGRLQQVFQYPSKSVVVLYKVAGLSTSRPSVIELHEERMP